jgi:methylmalonyl-CoA carboxyltransferase large subunit
LIVTLLGFILVVFVVAIACMLTYVAMRRSSRQSLAEFKQAEQQIASLKISIAALETQIQQLSRMTATPATPPAATSQQPVSKPAPVQAADQEITPDLLVVMAAAVTAFLGKKVRIRSARALQSPYEIVNPWSQQGRVIVQASHNLRQTG